MIGQTFAPLGDPMQKTMPGQPSGAGATAPGAQRAIQVLNLRMPHVAGASAPAPQALLDSRGSAGLPQQGTQNPALEAILRAVLGHFATQTGAPQGMPGGMPGGGMPNTTFTPGASYGNPPSGPLPAPKTNFERLPGGTATGPAPTGPPAGAGTPPQYQNAFDYRR